MKKRIFVLTSIAVATLVGSSFAMAGNRPGAVTVTVEDSYYHFANKRHIDNANVPNAAIAYDFDKNWAMEFGMGIINSHINRPAVNSQEGTHGYLYTLDGLYRFGTFSVFEPFVSFGVGELNVYPNGYDSTHQGNINAGIGSQLFASDSIAFRGEIRDLYTLSGGKNDFMVGLGMSFLFDTCPCHHAKAMPSYKGDA